MILLTPLDGTWPTPADNAEIESFFATIKGERLYLADYDDPIKMINDVDSFVRFYNEDRLHQGVGFVTPPRSTTAAGWPSPRRRRKE